MESRTVGIGLLLALFAAGTAGAQDGDPAESKKLYDKQCSVCHGNMAQTKTGDLAPTRSKRYGVQVAMAPSGGPTLTDFSSTHAAVKDLIAVVPIYGPPLAGVIGRVAGTFKGYTYSEAFLKTMEGVAWDETNLDAWIKSSQTLVPGSFMFYSQKKPDVRSKIIEYLKAQ